MARRPDRPDAHVYPQDGHTVGACPGKTRKATYPRRNRHPGGDLTQFPVRLGVRFGSTVHETGGPHSDIDIAVEFDPEIPAERRRRARLRLSVDLSPASGSDEVDLAGLDGIRPEIGASALEHGIVVHGETDRAEELRRRFAERVPDRTSVETLEPMDELIADMAEDVGA